MKLAAVTFGSRGDVEPYVAFGRELVAAGYEVRLTAQQAFRESAGDSGVEFVGVRGRSIQDLVDSPEGKELVANLRNPFALARQLGRLNDMLSHELELIYTDVLAATEGADAVLCSPATFPALDVAAHLGLPVVQMHLIPLEPTSRFPAPVAYINARTLTPLGNRLSYPLDELLVWRLLKRAVEPVRARVLGRGPRRARETLAQRRRRLGALVGISPTVLPRPRDWSPDVVSCGYWWSSPRSSEQGSLDEATLRFLAAGPPPIFVSLGSMPIGDPRAVTAILAQAARDANVRLILQRGWAGLGEGLVADHVHVTGELPHGAIFDLVAAVAHHGGAGSIARGLRHGKPTLVMPVLADQFFWGRRMVELGVGPSPLPLRRLDRSGLARRLAALATPAFTRRAGAVAADLQREDGGAVATEALGRFLDARRGSTRGSEHVRARQDVDRVAS